MQIQYLFFFPISFSRVILALCHLPLSYRSDPNPGSHSGRIAPPPVPTTNGTCIRIHPSSPRVAFRERTRWRLLQMFFTGRNIRLSWTRKHVIGVSTHYCCRYNHYNAGGAREYPGTLKKHSILHIPHTKNFRYDILVSHTNIRSHTQLHTHTLLIVLLRGTIVNRIKYC